MSDSKILVTGGSGFLGGWCVRHLLSDGRAVRATVRSEAAERTLRSMLDAHKVPVGRLSVARADLASDSGWSEAFEDVSHALHIASPTSASFPKDASALLEQARGGTLRVLRAARAAGVQRIAVTSSTYAAAYPEHGAVSDQRTEADWTDPDDRNISPYVRAKTLAESAAWSFAESEWQRERLATICPGGLVGPLMSAELPDSMQFISRILAGKMPGFPKTALPIVDVRDCADLHILALFAPEAAGERFFATGSNLWMVEVAQEMRRVLGEGGQKVKAKELSNWVIRLAAMFDANSKSLLPELGRRLQFSSEKAQRLLGWNTRDLAETIRDAAASLKPILNEASPAIP
jgi:dihydroflavonol-4-reductase